MKRPLHLLLMFMLAGLHPGAVLSVSAAEEFTDLQCLSDIQSKDLCNASFYKNFLKLNFVRTGRSVKIDYRNIVNWNYSDSSLRKTDWQLASRIGILGLLFTRVEHEHVFTIVYLDEFGDRQVALLDFDNIQYVAAMKEALGAARQVP
jgi:hypothetical protein